MQVFEVGSLEELQAQMAASEDSARLMAADKLATQVLINARHNEASEVLFLAGILASFAQAKSLDQPGAINTAQRMEKLRAILLNQMATFATVLHNAIYTEDGQEPIEPDPLARTFAGAFLRGCGQPGFFIPQHDELIRFLDHDLQLWIETIRPTIDQINAISEAPFEEGAQPN
jgi:hypothetical protein